MPGREENKSAKKSLKTRFGIGEWYGRSFVRLAPEDRRELAGIQGLPKGQKPQIICPFRSAPGSKVFCTKAGGVCSLRHYQLDEQTQRVSWPSGGSSHLVTTCPHRFKQEGLIFKWIGETLLRCSDPLIVSEVGFLEQETVSGTGEARAADGEDVGRIDNVLVHPGREPLHWAALEIQAVYFSGPSMSKEFTVLRTSRKNALPFPVAIRRPDYRSSGPKRLMPQLQIKLPTLRRWGKKMAVVVDHSFFSALGSMDDVRDVSNCDIAWFVVDFDESGGEFALRPGFVRLTTLERAVEGLTGGNPVSLGLFEQRIREKLGGSYRPAEARPDSG
jgi:restriction endonuclease NotI